MTVITPLVLSGLSLFAASAVYATPTSANSPVKCETGGQTHIVMLADHAPHAPEVLARLGLSPDHNDVRHLYHNPAFRGFSANIKDQCIGVLKNMSDVLHVEKSQKIIRQRVLPKTRRDNTPLDLPVETPKKIKTGWKKPKTRKNVSWGLQRLSTLEPVTGDPRNLTYTYTYPARSTLGRGVDIYVIDSGIYTKHSAFGGRARLGWSFVPEHVDEDGHGTHVAGIAAGDMFGVASNANIISVKVFGKSGVGAGEDAVAGIDWVINQHDSRRNARDPTFKGSVINLSWATGAEPGFNVFADAVKGALRHGIHVALAAGNENYSDACNYDPTMLGGKNSSAVVAGSLGPTDAISSFSNIGPCVDVYAPGESIMSAWIGGPQRVEILDGSSMATPFVAGVMARLITEDPSGHLTKTPKQLKHMLTLRSQPDRLNQDGVPVSGDILNTASDYLWTPHKGKAAWNAAHPLVMDSSEN